MDNQNNHDEEIEARRCAGCHRELRMGDDALVLEHGVIGPRGLVTLGDRTYLCDHDCLERYCNGSNADVERLPRRIP